MVSESDLDICIIGGCGHIGLPLALTFTNAGLRVGIYDLDASKIEQVQGGKMPFLESGADELLDEALAADRLAFSISPKIISRAPIVICVVGTPIDEFLNPSLHIFEDVIEDAAPWLQPRALVVLRSTVYPGTTEWVEKALGERGCDVDVVFCPERIAEGKAVQELRELPQIIGSDSAVASERATELFALTSVKPVMCTTREAELAKLFTNTWRYMKFAVANQFFTIATDAGLDYNRVLNAIRFDYPRAQDLPSPGFAAGPCLLKDTMQLSAFTGNTFVLGHAAMMVNEGLPEMLVRKIDRDFGLSGKTVAILGMAFKAESDDIRASLSYKLRKLLWFAGATVVCTDPFVEAPEILTLDEALADAEIVVIGAPHEAYRDIDLGERVVIDVWAVAAGEISV